MLQKIEDKRVFSSELLKDLGGQRIQNWLYFQLEISGFLSVLWKSRGVVQGQLPAWTTPPPPLIEGETRLCPLGNEARGTTTMGYKFRASGFVHFFHKRTWILQGQERWGVSASPSTPTSSKMVLGRALPHLAVRLLFPSWIPIWPPFLFWWTCSPCVCNYSFQCSHIVRLCFLLLLRARNSFSYYLLHTSNLHI